MPYLLIEDFKNGLDVRKSSVTAPPGTLLELTNAHLTRGGEIEKRQAFIDLMSLPPGLVKGMAGAPGVLYLFGQADLPAGFQFSTTGNAEGLNVIYQKLGAPEGLTNPVLLEITSVEFWGRKPFVVAKWRSDTAKPEIDGDPSDGDEDVTPTETLVVSLQEPSFTGTALAGSGGYDLGPQIVNVTASEGDVSIVWNPIPPSPVNYSGNAQLYLESTGEDNERLIKVLNSTEVATLTTRVYVDVSDANGTTRLNFDVTAIWQTSGDGGGGGGGGGDPWPPMEMK